MDKDYREYLSYDNGKGVLIRKNDIPVFEKYCIPYQECTSLKELLCYLEDVVVDDPLLDEMIIDLYEEYYYHYVNK